MNPPTRHPRYSRLAGLSLVVLLLIIGVVFSPRSLHAQAEAPRVEVPAELPAHPRLFWNNDEIAAFKNWMAQEPWVKKYIDDLTAELNKTVDAPRLPERNQSQNVEIAQQAHRYAIIYALTGDRRYAEAVAKIFRAYVEHFPSYPVAHLKGRATSSTLGECDWAINAASAYDLIYNSGVLSDRDKEAIEQEVLKPSGEVMRSCNHRFRSNWRGRAIAGVAAIGFCINNREMIEEAVNGHRDENGQVVRDGFVQHVAWSILADGVFYERSMHYHMYTAEAYAIIAEAARHSGVDLWNLEVPGHKLDAGADMQRSFGQTGKKTVKAIFDSQFYEAFGDGTLVRLGNSYTDRLERTRCYERAWAAYRDLKYAWILSRPVKFIRPIAGGGYIEPDKKQVGVAAVLPNEGDIDARRPLSPLGIVWLAPETIEGKFSLEPDATIGITGRHENSCTLLPNGGITLLRQSAAADAVGVQMTYGDWGSCHTHPELLAIAIHARGKLIVPEVRYHHYGHADFLNWDRQTIAHNTVTVDQTSQYPQGDSDDRWIVERGGKQAFGHAVFFHPGEDMKAFRAKCEAAYDGVALDRTIVLVDDVLVDFYRCRSDEPHQYDYALHIDGQLEQTSVDLSEPQTGPLSDKLGYMHITGARRGLVDGAGAELEYDGGEDGPAMRLRLLSSGKTEVISGQGHADLKGRVKDVLILRQRGANVDFLDVMSFAGKAGPSARRLTDTPAGVLGVELTMPSGDVLLVLSADEPSKFDYAGQAIEGQLALLRHTKDGATRVVSVVP